MWFISLGLRQGSGLCSSSSRKYPGTEGTHQNRHCNHHRWHATKSLEWNQLSFWCLQNYKGYIYRAPVRHVTKTWSVVLLNKIILLHQVYWAWQVVKTQKIIWKDPVESQRVNILSSCEVCNKIWCAVLLNKKIYIYCYMRCILYDKLLKPRQSFRIIL